MIEGIILNKLLKDCLVKLRLAHLQLLKIAFPFVEFLLEGVILYG
jgi:hypothetical protein